MAPRSKECVTFDAQPYAFSFPLKHTALLIIDMQRDFLLPGGFGHIQGGDLAAVQASIAPTKRLLQLCRDAGMHVFHTREGHAPDLSDLPTSKTIRQASYPGNTQYTHVVGDKGEMGRLLVRGEYGHDLIDELAPLPGEVVIDKPGKGSFWNTRFMEKLQQRAITHILVSGVTTECCFATTLREANDRGFECCGIAEATAGFDKDFRKATFDMITFSQGLFGFIGGLEPLAEALKPYTTGRSSAHSSTATPPQTPPVFDGDLRIDALAESYRAGLSPVSLVEALYNKIEAYHKIDSAVWISLETRESVLAQAMSLSERFPDKTKLPVLFGVPFSVKDNIDVKGKLTTAACPPLSYVASKSATVYDRCIAEGAIYLGKTNLDQLATGLNGTRSPYGVPHSVYSKEYISGGSSSGSAVSVAAKLASFSFGTDTAGSGRVPAALNGVVGFKPTRGTLSFTGVVPACLSLDTVSLMAQTVSDCRKVWEICEGYDRTDRYAKETPPALRHVNALGSFTFNFGIPPPSALAVCSPVYRKLFYQAVQTLQTLGGNLVEIDWEPFEKGGQLLYDGTFVSERIAGLPDNWLSQNKSGLHPVIAQIFTDVESRNSTAVQAYRDLQNKALYTRQALDIFTEGAGRISTLLVPTTTSHPTIKEMLSDPIKQNSSLGYFTHCGNVLDLTGVAVPAAEFDASELRSSSSITGNTDSSSSRTTLPFGVTFLGSARTDAEVLEIARRFTEATGL